MNTLLIAGTDTDAGKTVVTTALAAYWQRYYSPRPLGLIKPVQSGVGDRELYQKLFKLDQTLDEINPAYFAAPLAPPLAAEREGRQVDLKPVWQTLRALERSRDWVLVEGLGGLGSPVTAELTVADLAAQWRLPTLLVVPVRLGAIAQAVANVALARQAQVALKGIILNCAQPRSPQEVADWAPQALIESLTQMPILGIMPHIAEATDLFSLSNAASRLTLDGLIPAMA
ncbi:MAG: ATP-dependent dethiobiotin synthetase BioD [Leptolyngbyaceae cyanobacterium SM1_1_3]|nr:ATP-dependent dethiobiotin synthetase BioD [Leptolyngbyaceae cyanobacterium SM1_1_3]NJN01548.1 ATP-dependent dethiobiotin synthetase BioD [Leptolyngbyaceae cyanobacterium RM1_1_2]NJO09843.1 ATP-dependent dethiobiotin synthetase BioD [Leptolyngbyaceae cyanobacterium SL_1_1]